MVGVDIGVSSVKVVEVHAARGDKPPMLGRCASELLDQGVVVDGNLVHIDAVAATIGAALRKARIRARTATLALPPALVETATLSLPDNLAQEELGVEIENEALRLYAPSEHVSYDHAVVAHNQAAQSLTIHIVATRRDSVQERVLALEMAGLKAHAMEVEETAIHRVMVRRARSAQPPRAPLAIEMLVHLGASYSMAIFYQDGVPVHREHLNSTGDQLTQNCARTFRQDLRKVEIQKRKNALPREWRVQVVQPSLELLAMEIQGAISSFAMRSTLGNVEQVLLSGGHAMLHGLPEAVQAQTRVPTERLDPFACMAIGTHINQRYYQRDLCALIVGAGLGMRGLALSS
ncbi:MULTISPECIES: type IV pilus assembly protein PilM [unclassified Cupriavidus]|uniref:type IV pilus assembly protein PilM n=1 Tax=Cupriavidus sp. H19C3 TaxID=3241603 RepID=UPI003BF7832F